MPVESIQETAQEPGQSVTVYDKAFFENASTYQQINAIGDLFARQQEIERLREIARTEKMGGLFSRMLTAYNKVNAPSKTVRAITNSTKFDFDPNQEWLCGEYECDENGVRLYNPITGTVTVCTHPILPIRRIVNIDTGETKAEIAFRRGGKWYKTIVEKTVLASAQKIVSLAAKGIAVNSENARDMVTYMDAMSEINYDTMTESKSVGRLGWVDGYGFSPYVDGLEFDGQDQYRHDFGCVKSSGSYDKWLECIREMRAGKSVAARIMLAASFASALVKPTNSLPFIVHCWSNVSGIGKTVGLMAAASVWAAPSSGEYIKTFNSTNVGLEMMAAFCGSLPLCLDELCLKSGRREQFDDMIYNLCEGTGRTRGSRNGGLQRQTSWLNCTISTGEEPLTSSSSRAGAQNRVLNVNAGNVAMFADAKAVVKLLARNYGFAGRAMVEAIQDDEFQMAQIQQWHQEYTDQLREKATEKQAISAALVLTADRWITENIFQDGRCLTVEEMAPILETKESTDVNARCYDWLMDIAVEYAGHFEPKEDGTYYGGECWGTVEWTKNLIWFIPSRFDALLNEQGYSPAGFKSWASTHGLLKHDRGKHTMLKRLDAGRPPTRCICLVMRTENESDGAETVKNTAENAFVTTDSARSDGVTTQNGDFDGNVATSGTENTGNGVDWDSSLVNVTAEISEDLPF